MKDSKRARHTEVANHGGETIGDGWMVEWVDGTRFLPRSTRSLVRIHVQGASCGFHVFRVTCPLKMPVNTDPTARGRVESGWNRWRVGGGKGEKVREFRDITRVSSVMLERFESLEGRKGDGCSSRGKFGDELVLNFAPRIGGENRKS